LTDRTWCICCLPLLSARIFVSKLCRDLVRLWFVWELGFFRILIALLLLVPFALDLLLSLYKRLCDFFGYPTLSRWRFCHLDGIKIWPTLDNFPDLFNFLLFLFKVKSASFFETFSTCLQFLFGEGWLGYLDRHAILLLLYKRFFTSLNRGCHLV
jgi:hypothetical protein